MAPPRRGFLTLIERYPEYADVIERLFVKDEMFFSLCEDYQVCSAALQHWNRIDSEEAPERRQEYASLLTDLEEEIHQILRAETKNQRCQGGVPEIRDEHD